jgi:hypothetical protein
VPIRDKIATEDEAAAKPVHKESHPMHTVFHRTKHVVLIVAGAAALAAGPAATIASADVRDNSGPVAKGHTRADPGQCQNYNDWYNDDVKAGDKKDAKYDKQLASDRGCTWAQARPGQAAHVGTDRR